jgi:hypothetical protein
MHPRWAVLLLTEGLKYHQHLFTQPQHMYAFALLSCSRGLARPPKALLTGLALFTCSTGAGCLGIRSQARFCGCNRCGAACVLCSSTHIIQQAVCPLLDCYSLHVWVPSACYCCTR